MGDRVNIHYSVELEELPNEVGNLLARSEEKLSDCYESIRKIIDVYGSKTMMTIACADEIRTKMTAVDYTLNDITNIISGYVRYKIEEEMKSLENSQPHEHPTEGDILNTDVTGDVPDAVQLEDRIREFKETL